MRALPWLSFGIAAIACSLPSAEKIGADAGASTGGASSASSSASSGSGAAGAAGAGGDGGSGTPVAEWARSYGTPGDDRAEAVAFDGLGRAIVAGRYDGTAGQVDLGTGPLAASKSVFVTARDVAGDAVWAIDSAGGDATVGGMTLDAAGDILLTGSFDAAMSLGGQVLSPFGARDVWVAKLAPNGVATWVSLVSSPGLDRSLAIATDGQSTFVAGAAGGDIDPGGGGIGSEDGDGFFGKIAPTGAPTWVTPLGGIGPPTGSPEEGTGVVSGPGGAGRVVGTFDGALDSMGACTSASSQGPDVFVAQIEVQSCHWLKTFGGPGPERSGGAAAIGADLVFAGTYGTPFQIGSEMLPAPSSPGTFVVRLDASGEPVWSRGIFGDGSVEATAVAAAGGRVFVAGHFDQTLDFAGTPLSSVGGNDAVVLVLDAATGEPTGAIAFGGPGDDDVVAIAVRDQAVLVGGWFTAEVALAGTNLISNGGADILMALLEVP